MTGQEQTGNKGRFPNISLLSISNELIGPVYKFVVLDAFQNIFTTSYFVTILPVFKFDFGLNRLVNGYVRNDILIAVNFDIRATTILIINNKRSCLAAPL